MHRVYTAAVFPILYHLHEKFMSSIRCPEPSYRLEGPAQLSWEAVSQRQEHSHNLMLETHLR